MKLYGVEFDLSKRAPQTVYVSQYSSFKIGIKGGTSIALYDGDTAVTAEADLFHGYKVFALVAGAASRKNYKVTIDGVDLMLTLVTTDSNVAELSAAGGGGGSYTLPIATETTLGGVKFNPAYGIKVDSDGFMALANASTSTVGGVIVGDGLSIDLTTGVLSATPQNYAPVAKSDASVTADDNAVNVCADTVTAITVPTTINDTLVYVKGSNITWTLTGWTLKSDDTDVFTFTAPALFSFTKLDSGELLVMKKDLSTVTL